MEENTDKHDGCSNPQCECNSTTKQEDWEERFDAEFSGQNQLTQAILGALEYRGFYDAGKYLDDSISERIAPILKSFITSEITKARIEVLGDIKEICNRCKTERGLATAIGNYITKQQKVSSHKD